MEYRFEWDPRKARQNLEKQGVSFAEAQTVFADPLAGFLADEFHSEEEERGILIGTSQKSRLLFVSFTLRQGAVRIISARTATPRERKRHEREEIN